MTAKTKSAIRVTTLVALWGLLGTTGCGWHQYGGPSYDRPFPIGQVTDSFWETQQTNGEAADFIFFDHEFAGQTANLAPGAKDKLMQVATRLEHVPFPVTIEQSPHNGRPQLDQQRRQVIVEQLARLGVPEADKRVVVAPAFTEGYTAIEGEAAYYQNIYGGFGYFGNGFFGGGAGRRFGGFGGMFR